MIHRAVGKLVLRSLIYLVRNRYRTQLRFAAGFGIAALLIGGYLASRGEVAEG